MSVTVREYTDNDYLACRQLWVELTEHHRRIYGDPSIGGDDPGAGFDDYLATSARAQSWVAESHGGVVGLTGLFDHGVSGEVEPVVVSEGCRQRGIGRALVDHVVKEATQRGYEYLSIRPVARNVAAIERFTRPAFVLSGAMSTWQWT
jgi:GNAT superfamily N-acetyltransferase